MAALALTPAQIELASSLTQDELPTKLRCAICSRLAVNAFRLPCCETAICEKCQSTLPSSCPVCEHSPVSGDDCTVYKSLRTTIRVFLKTEEKKREASRPKTNSSTPSTPAQTTTATIQSQASTEPPPEEEPVASVHNDAKPLPADRAPSTAPAVSDVEADTSVATEVAAASAAPEHEISTGDQSRDQQVVASEETQVTVPDGQENEDGTGSGETKEDVEGEGLGDQPGQSGTNFGFDPMNANFNMNFPNGDMNQMQMMMAMQNGMNPAAFGAFPMMGMMDPMVMQNMMMNGGFGAQGMGMNGMNMNMGMNGFSGGGNDWNGQQSWNVGQDNFNPSAPGMGNGDFGNFNTGFRNGHHNQFNDYRRGNFGYRGRGRGRGFYGGYARGYHQGFNTHNAGWTEKMSQFSGGGSDGQAAAPSINQATEVRSGKVDEFGRTIRTDSEPAVQATEQNGHSAPEGSHDAAAVGEGDNLTPENQGQVVKEPAPRSEVAQGGLANYGGDMHSAGQHPGPRVPSNGALGSVLPQTMTPDVPLNAPTGPKAMRQGLPNTSLHNLKARGFITDEKSPAIVTNAPVVASPVEDRPRSRSSSLQSRKDKDRRHREHRRERDPDEKSRGKEHDRERGRSRTHSLTRSPSPSRDRKESRRHKRHRSASMSGDSRDGDHRRRRHKSRRRSTRDDEDYKGRSREDKYDQRSRSQSPVDREHRRSSHRSHRDRDEKRRDREKDRDRDSDYDRHRKSTHRSHRDRDQDRERDRDRERERDKGRGKDRTRDHEKEHRHRSNRDSPVAPPTPIEPSDKNFNPPTGPRGSFSIKGASSKPSSGTEVKNMATRPSNPPKRESEPSRRPSQSSSAAGQKSTSGVPTKDPHTLEREARDRERLLKEAQRIAGLAGRSGVKRSREGGDDRGSRRKSRRSEAVSMDEGEDRMRRLEAEREGRRWD
ncbi:hypothetical protein F5X96DRAFT_638098 [Biscogniauxia mediterranea]|nr:hypothetical protein F5X96DRAFT_638098 [Biscogniauxia mediterranea]